VLDREQQFLRLGLGSRALQCVASAISGAEAGRLMRQAKSAVLAQIVRSM
jgi:hypothetical protein